jgi:GNAT superfamily N-acetyltransferase
LSLSYRFSGVAILIRLGDAADVDAAVSVFEQSNLARRQAVWPNRAARVERVRTHLRDPASWFLVADEGSALVGMASAEVLRGEDGAGGLILDAVLGEAKRRHYSRIHLWTHEDNERSHRLYRSRGFSPTGRTGHGEGEWAREILTRT